jgi:cytoskeletal protein CcmA (bactofilin family)
LTNSELLTYIAKGTKITADIHSEQDIHLSGEVTGDIVCTKKFVLTPSGALNGTVQAEQADVSGTIDGEIRINGSLHIQGGAKIKGVIFAKKLQVQSGAQIYGAVHSGPEVDVTQKVDSTPKEDAAPSSNNEERVYSEMLISLPNLNSDNAKTESLRSAATQVMETLDFKLDIYGDEESEPYFQRFVFMKKGVQNETSKDFEQVLGCMEASFLNKKGERFPNDLYKACVILSNSLKEVESYSLRLGDVLLLKFKDDTGETVISELLSSSLKETLKNKPELIKSPQEFLGELEH